jgi:histone H3/H4
MIRRLHIGRSKKQIAEEADNLDGIIKYMLQQSPVTIRDLVMTQNLEPKPVRRLLKILANAGIVEKVGKTQWILTIPFATNPVYDANKIAASAASTTVRERDLGVST